MPTRSTRKADTTTEESTVATAVEEPTAAPAIELTIDDLPMPAATRNRGGNEFDAMVEDAIANPRRVNIVKELPAPGHNPADAKAVANFRQKLNNRANNRGYKLTFAYDGRKLGFDENGRVANGGQHPSPAYGCYLWHLTPKVAAEATAEASEG